MTSFKTFSIISLKSDIFYIVWSLVSSFTYRIECYVLVGLTSDGEDANESIDDHMQSIVVAYRGRLSEKLKAELAEDKLSDGAEDNTKQEFGRWPTTWWQQFSVLLRRGVKERKHGSFALLKIIEVLAVSLLTALLWWKSHISHLQDQVTNHQSLQIYLN